MDLMLTLLCALTLLVIAFAGCGSTSKQEEVLDTLLLVARNVLQFGRLAAVMRQWETTFLRKIGYSIGSCQIWPVNLFTT